MERLEAWTQAGFSVPLQGTSFTDPALPEKGKWFYVIEALDKKGVVSEESLPVEIRIEYH